MAPAAQKTPLGALNLTAAAIFLNSFLWFSPVNFGFRGRGAKQMCHYYLFLSKTVKKASLTLAEGLMLNSGKRTNTEAGKGHKQSRRTSAAQSLSEFLLKTFQLQVCIQRAPEGGALSCKLLLWVPAGDPCRRLFVPRQRRYLSHVFYKRITAAACWIPSGRPDAIAAAERLRGFCATIIIIIMVCPLQVSMAASCFCLQFF